VQEYEKEQQEKNNTSDPVVNERHNKAIFATAEQTRILLDHAVEQLLTLKKDLSNTKIGAAEMDKQLKMLKQVNEVQQSQLDSSQNGMDERTLDQIKRLVTLLERERNEKIQAKAALQAQREEVVKMKIQTLQRQAQTNTIAKQLLVSAVEREKREARIALELKSLQTMIKLKPSS